jgi:hypothetical protein
MIRYPITHDELKALVDASEKGTDEEKWWRTRAENRTLEFQRLGKYEESSSIWGEVKSHYINLQHDKCIYCEKKLEGYERGEKRLSYAGVEWPLEHFRPKGKVKAWFPQEPTSGLTYDDTLPLGDDFDGYYLLAYHLFNYAASCHTCNSALKWYYFPIAGSRVQGHPNPEDYRDERPYLVYPLDENDDDPEELITFLLHQAVPKYTAEVDLWKYQRACVIIDFLGLNRQKLQALRAEHLRIYVLSNIKQNDTFALSHLISPAGAFSSCSKCFILHCRKNPAWIPFAETMLNGILAEYEAT